MKVLLSWLMSSTVFAQVVSIDKPEIEAQRRQYEQHLTHKVEGTLGNLLEENSFVVNVSVRLRRLGAETIEIKDEKKTNQIIRETLEIDKEFNGEAGLVPLSKLGVWTVKGEEKVEDGSTKATSFSKRVRNFSELIRTISIDVILDEDRVDPDRVDVVRQVVRQLLSNKLPVQAAINIRSLKMGTVSKTKENLKKELLSELDDKLQKAKSEMTAERTLASEEKQDLLSQIKPFKNSLALLFATLCFFALGMVLSKRYVKIQEKRMVLDESIALRQMQASQKLEMSDASDSLDNKTVINNLSGEDSDVISGFKQFVEIVETQPERAAFLVKQWLYSEDLNTQSLLAALPKIVKLSKLRVVLDLLSETDRKQWNRINSMAPTNLSFTALDDFIGQLISTNMIEPEVEIDEETKQLIAGMTPQEGLRCIKSDVEIGSLLASTMPSLQYTRVLSLVDDETIKRIASASRNLDSKQLQYTAVKLEKLVSQIRQESAAKSSVFLEKVPSLIRELGYTKEKAIFESVAEGGDAGYLIDLAHRLYPAELVAKLPYSMIEDVLDTMELAPKAELIACMPEYQDFLVDSIRSGKMQEIILMEVDEINNNEIRKKALLRNKHQRWQGFLNRVRLEIQKNEFLQEELSPVLQSWAQSMISANSSTGGFDAA